MGKLFRSRSDDELIMTLINNNLEIIKAIAKNDSHTARRAALNPTAFEDAKMWELKSVLPCYETTRARSMTEMLFLMLKAASR